MEEYEVYREIYTAEGIWHMEGDRLYECEYDGKGGNVVIPEEIGRIGEEVFKDWESLTSVVISEGVVEIRNWAFAGCKNLTSVVIPKSLGGIGASAFRNCTSLTSVTMLEGVRRFGTRVTIWEGVRCIDDYAFAGCTSLTGITIPKNIDIIGYRAFAGCRSLTDVTISEVDRNNTGAVIYDGAFQDCESLASITIPKNVIRMDGFYIFWNCASLTSISVSAQNDVFASEDGVLFCKDKTKLLCYPPGRAGAYAIPEGVVEIGAGAFRDCKKLTGVTIPRSVSIIGNAAFWGCCSLTDVAIPESVSEVRAMAFHRCTGLTRVSLPESVSFIGDWAFSECAALTDVTAEGAGFVAENAFDGCPCQATVSRQLANKAVIPKPRTAEIENGTQEESAFCVENGVLTDYDGKGGDVVIPDGVTEIGNRAFSRCQNLTSVTIPGSVTKIGDHAFYDCENLASVMILDGVTEIGKDAFYNCKTLASVVIPRSVAVIGRSAFYGCLDLISVTIPEGVRAIGEMAFNDCPNLIRVTIPESATEIGGDVCFRLFSDGFGPHCPIPLTVYGVAGSRAE